MKQNINFLKKKLSDIFKSGFVLMDERHAMVSDKIRKINTRIINLEELH